MKSRSFKYGFSKHMPLHAVLLFIVLAVSYIFVSSYYSYRINDVKRAEYVDNERHLVDLEKQIVSNHIAMILSDLLYLSDIMQASPIDDKNLENLQQNWFQFASRKEIYYKIRFLDKDGFEKIRINYTSAGAEIVTANDLQSKKDRYFFQNTITLKKGQVYVSPFDLNMENDLIEFPFKPMLRLSTPIFDNSGEVRGVLILNYYAQYILDDYRQISNNSLGDVFLLNPDGYWIYNPKNPKSEWAFMFRDRGKNSFAASKPNAWANINSSEIGSFYADDGYYTYVHINPVEIYSHPLSNHSDRAEILGDGHMIAVSRLPNSGEMGRILDTRFSSYLFYTVKDHTPFLLILLLLSFLLAGLQSINKNTKEKIHHYSLDQMTGTLTRRSGYERLEQVYQTALRTSTSFSLFFVDVNGLKEVNDRLGHRHGDELLITVCDGMKKSIRPSDFIIRFGGDEFLLVLQGVSPLQIEDIWQRIQAEYNHINATEDRPYLVSVSHGIESLIPGQLKNLDDMIRSADLKMYLEKRQLKETLQVLR